MENRAAAVRYFALIFGAMYALVGLMGFIPGITQPPDAAAPDLAVDASYGYLLGLFPVNLMHNLVHLAVGLWGVASFKSFSASRFYARANAVLFAVLMVMGLVPGMNTMFGLAPLFGHDVWLHALTAGLTGYFGFVHAPAAQRAHGMAAG